MFRLPPPIFSSTRFLLLAISIHLAAAPHAAEAASAKPVITQQPESQTVAIGDIVSLSVAASGEGPFTYQWRKSGTTLRGKTEDYLIIEPALASNSGTYSVVVRNAAGSVTSEPAKLSVLAPPAITTHPAPPFSLVGSSVTLSVRATGAPPLHYQWFKDETAIEGAQSATLTLTNLTLADAGDYSVVVSNAVGSATSENGELIVEVPSPLPVILSQPEPQTVRPGAFVAFEVGIDADWDAEGLFSVQWYRDGKPIDFDEARLSRLEIHEATFANAGLYTAVVKSNTGSVTSAPARLVVEVPPPAVLEFDQALSVGALVNASLEDKPLPDGVVYRAVGLPAGLSLDAYGNVSGLVRAKPGTYRIRYWTQHGRQKSEIRELVVRVGPFPSRFVGNYEALLNDANGPAARLRFTVGRSGVVTGQAISTHHAAAFSFRSFFHYSAYGDAGFYHDTQRKGRSPVAGSVSFDEHTGEIVVWGAIDGPPRPMSGDGEPMRTSAPGDADPAAGRYTLSLRSDVVLPPYAGNPVGGAFATATIDRAGGLKLTGRVPDGRPFTGHYRPTQSGQYYVFAKPRARIGHGLGGSLRLQVVEDVEPLRFTATAPIVWNRASMAGRDVHPYLDAHRSIPFTARLRPWLRPSREAGSLAELLGVATDAPLDFDLTETAPHTDTLPSELILDASGNLSANSPEQARETRFRIRLSPLTGALNGSFHTVDWAGRTRKATLHGILTQRLASDIDEPLGSGFFLVPSHGLPGQLESGRLQID